MAENVSGKRALGLAILNILREHSDAEHPLLQREIIDLLASEYHLQADRKTIYHNTAMLIDMGCPIEHNNDGWYYAHEFTDPELKVMIDSLPDSLPKRHRRQLVRKITGLGSRWFAAGTEHRRAPENEELMYTLDVLQEAVRRRCRVVFNYGYMDIDKQLHVKLNSEGAPKDYTISPYRTVISGGHYLLLGNTDPYDGITHYRVDRIRHIRLLDEVPARPMQDTGIQVADIAAYLTQRPYMFSDAPRTVCFRIERRMIGDVLDWFGMDVTLKQPTEATVEVETRVSLTAMKYWALQYGESCEVLSPVSLRQELKSVIGKMSSRYQDENDGREETCS